MKEISHRLNDRLSDLPYLSESEEILREYYNRFPLDTKRKTLLEDTFSIVDEIFEAVKNSYSDDDRQLIINYVYKLKGNLRSIQELCRFLEIEIGEIVYNTGKIFEIEIIHVNTDDVTNFYKVFEKVINELLFNSGIDITVRFVVYRLKTDLTYKIYSYYRCVNNLIDMEVVK